MTITKDNEEGLKKQMGSWYPWMIDLIQSDIWNQLYAFLKAQKPAGKVVIPASGDTWKSLSLCPKDSVRCVILLQCPYATQREITGKGKVTISNGVPMDCSNIVPYIQPSLYMWYQAISEQYGFDPDVEERGDISYLLEQEGVLLMNTQLTVELGKVNSHQQVWAPTIQWFIENVINQYLNGIPVVLIGSEAQRFEKFFNPLANPIKKCEHPASASYQNRNWKHEDMHLWLDNIIVANNGPLHKIRWTRNKGEDTTLPP